MTTAAPTETGMDVTFDGDRMRVHFDRFGIDAYRSFLQAKRLPEYDVEFDGEGNTYTITAPKRFAAMLGVTPPSRGFGDLPFPESMMDDQIAVTTMALEAKRFAYWGDCGLGKTFVQLEWARQVVHRTGSRVLLLTLNEVVPQTIAEARKFYGDSFTLRTFRNQEDLLAWCKDGDGEHSVGITNYEKLNPKGDTQLLSELRHLAGVAVDENRLKTGGGQQKWTLIKSTRGVEYKLSCTATPAPNDTMEFASQASFLERMRNEGEIIWTYFHRDKTTHRWTVKRHARDAFFEFMSGWSIYVRDPRKYGWREGWAGVPEPVYFTHTIDATAAQAEAMRRFTTDANGQMRLYEKDNTNAIERVKLSEIAKGFVYHGDGSKRTVERIESRKPAAVADIIAGERAQGLVTLVWTQFDAEGEILSEELKSRGIAFELITGKTPKKNRIPILDRFRRGETGVLIGKAKLLGWGMNFQVARSMVFSGWSDSFEEFYQALRRAYRYGQTESLRVHLPVVCELEGDMLENVLAKEQKHLAAIDDMERLYIQARKAIAGSPEVTA